MSMAGNPSLIVDVLANNAQLGTGLRSAEAQVTASAGRMGKLVDAQMGKFSTQIVGTLSRGLSAMVAVQAADAAIRATTEAFRNNRDIPDAILESMQRTFSSVPIFGAIQDALIPLGERLGTSIAQSAVGVMQREFGMFAGMTFSDRGNEPLIAERTAELERLRRQASMASVETVDTAIGRFRVATDTDKAQQEQVEILRRIESIMQELGMQVKGAN
jgi:hypothetical protein